MNLSVILCAAIQWDKVGIVLGLIAGVAIVLAVAILIITKLCHIQEDEKVLKVIEHLAGANCGGCGYSGCEGFAKGLCSGKACLNDCKVTSNDEKAKIAQIANLEFAAESPTVAVVRCNGGDAAQNKFDYIGNQDCVSEMLFHNGQKVCTTACLGLGSCTKVCPVGAIKIVDKKAIVDPSICTSCGNCLKTCPRVCIERIPATAPVYVACHSHCKGKEVMGQCSNGCIACGLCARNCPQKAIEMIDNLPVIDYTKCTGCKTCVLKCPKHVIKVHGEILTEEKSKAENKQNKK